MKYCCKDMENSITDIKTIEINDGDYFVNGCCGSCYVMGISYCPFCGKELSKITKDT